MATKIFMKGIHLCKQTTLSKNSHQFDENIISRLNRIWHNIIRSASEYLMYSIPFWSSAGTNNTMRRRKRMRKKRRRRAKERTWCMMGVNMCKFSRERK